MKLPLQRRVRRPDSGDKARDLNRRFRAVSRRYERKQSLRQRGGLALRIIMLVAIVTPAFIAAGYVLFSGSASLGVKVLPELVGRASVVDGDTIEIHGRRIRLYGIDAPESDQLCTIGGSKYQCGRRAALALADFIGQRTISCEQRDTDRYGRAVAVCSAGAEDLGAWLVSNGHALAYRRYSTDYVTEEAAAAAAHRGIWAGDFDAPWDWRRR